MKTTYIMILLSITLIFAGCYEGFEQPGNIDGINRAKFNKDVILYPNPINEGDKINLYYELSDSCKVNTSIYNLTGDLLKSISKGLEQKKGKHDIEIETTNENGERLTSGFYILAIHLESTAEKKIPFEIK